MFLFIILARNIDCKSILQKTLNQFGLVASKYERKSRYKSNFRCVSLRRRVALICRSRHMFLQKAFQFGFLSWKPCLFLLESRLEFVIDRGKPKFISLPVKFPADRSKFQFCTTTTRSKLIRIFTRTVLPCLCFFLNPAAEIMLSILFNTLLKITPHNTQKRRRRRKERTKWGSSRRYSRWVTHPVPNPARQGLT